MTCTLPMRLTSAALAASLLAAGAGDLRANDSSEETPRINVFANGWHPAHALIIRDVVSHFDANEDGVITLAEYRPGMIAAFERWDLTGDWFLEPQELPSGIADFMPAMMDHDRDGYVTYAEYKTVMTQIGYATDHDNDLRIKAAEIADIVRWGRLEAPGRRP